MRGLPIQTELDATELPAFARRETRSRVAPRLCEIALVLDGVNRADAAQLCGTDRQALRDAVMRVNAEGLGGLMDWPWPGRKPRLNEGEQAALAGLILRGPRTGQSGMPGWAFVDPCLEVEANRGKCFDPASLPHVMRRLGLSRQKARQAQPHSDAQA